MTNRLEDYRGNCAHKGKTEQTFCIDIDEYIFLWSPFHCGYSLWHRGQSFLVYF
jgi:hypothetical protein